MKAGDFSTFDDRFDDEMGELQMALHSVPLPQDRGPGTSWTRQLSADTRDSGELVPPLVGVIRNCATGCASDSWFHNFQKCVVLTSTINHQEPRLNIRFGCETIGFLSCAARYSDYFSLSRCLRGDFPLSTTTGG